MEAGIDQLMKVLLALGLTIAPGVAAWCLVLSIWALARRLRRMWDERPRSQGKRLAEI